MRLLLEIGPPQLETTAQAALSPAQLVTRVLTSRRTLGRAPASRPPLLQPSAARPASACRCSRMPPLQAAALQVVLPLGRSRRLLSRPSSSPASEPLRAAALQAVLPPAPPVRRCQPLQLRLCCPTAAGLQSTETDYPTVWYLT